MDAEQPIGRHRLGLSLEFERLDLLHVYVVADEPVGQLAEQDLALARGLLETCCDVDGVAGDEPLPG